MQERLCWCIYKCSKIPWTDMQ